MLFLEAFGYFDHFREFRSFFFLVIPKISRIFLSSKRYWGYYNHVEGLNILIICLMLWCNIVVILSNDILIIFDVLGVLQPFYLII